MFADKQETLEHFQDMYNRYGSINLMVWTTSTGKWIDESVLFELAHDGKIRRVSPKHINMYAQGRWEYIPTK